MEPIEILKNEHRVIEGVLDALEEYVKRSERGAVVDDKAELLQFVEFVQEFADKCHHGKEEDILFAEMIDAGFPRESGPLGVMFHEHDEGRVFVGELMRLGEQAEPWTNADRGRLSKAAFCYIDLLRQHIRKEDGVLYPMAEAQLSTDVMRSIGQRFQEFEHNRTGAGETERLHLLGAKLASRYLSQDASQ
jgi:hemerythrin-like domain-containing protein